MPKPQCPTCNGDLLIASVGWICSRCQSQIIGYSKERDALLASPKTSQEIVSLPDPTDATANTTVTDVPWKDDTPPGPRCPICWVELTPAGRNYKCSSCKRTIIHPDRIREELARMQAEEDLSEAVNFNVIEGGFKLLPPPPDCCRICATKHEPYMAHDATSLFYQMRFQMRYKRQGTWADAAAHCLEEIQVDIKQFLSERGLWTEPPEGVAPIREPIDG